MASKHTIPRAMYLGASPRMNKGHQVSSSSTQGRVPRREYSNRPSLFRNACVTTIQPPTRAIKIHQSTIVNRRAQELLRSPSFSRSLSGTSPYHPQIVRIRMWAGSWASQHQASQRPSQSRQSSRAFQALASTR